MLKIRMYGIVYNYDEKRKRFVRKQERTKAEKTNTVCLYLICKK